MQIGIITIGGRRVGLVSLTEGEPDTLAPQLYSPESLLADADQSFDDADPLQGGFRGGGHHGSHGGGDDRHIRDGRDSRSHGSRDINLKDPEPGTGDRVYGRFAEARDHAREEIKAKPWLNEKAMHIFAGENPDPAASTALWESAINRMAVRGTSLEKELRTTGEGGYYAGYNSNVSEETRKTLENSRDRALNYSNISGYATDNASGGLAERDTQSGRFAHRSEYNREHFFAPGSAEPRFRDNWRSMVYDSEASRAAASEAIAPPSMMAKPSETSTAVADSKGGGRLSGHIDPRVDPRIPEIVGAAATHLPPGYKVEMTSGYRGENAPNHNGRAADFHIVDPQGNVLRNRGEDPDGMYQTLARHAYGEQRARHPELNGQFAWGGAFGTALGGGGERDLMHFDINGERGRYAEHQLHNMGPMPGVTYGPQPTRPAQTADAATFDPGTMVP